jgi:hypothetical protein
LTGVPDASPPGKGAAAPSLASNANAAASWQPLVSDAVWKSSVANDHEFQDGLLHKQGYNGIHSSQLVTDGAVRARIRVRDGMKGPGLRVRHTADWGNYNVWVKDDWSAVTLSRVPSGKIALAQKIPAKQLGSGKLPKLSAGDTLTLELRAQGKHFTVLANDSVIFEADDDALPGPGQWGISALDGWFESAELQTP